jgi:hypothetical protein
MALEAAYAFDDVAATTVVDLSGNGRDLDLTGSAGAQVSGGQTGGALGKTGSTMPVLPAAVLSASETDDRTIMLDVLGTDRAVWVIRWNDDVLGSGVFGVLALDGATMQSRARRQSDSAAAGAVTFGTSQAGSWHNLCLTYVRSTAVLTAYWDGVLASSGVPSGWSPGQQLMVGADRIDLAEWTTTGPAIDNLRIFSHALNSGEVAALAGTPVAAGGDFQLALDPAGEVDTAVPFGSAKARAVGPAAVVEVAQAFGRHKALALGTAVDTVTARPLTRSKALTLAAAVETNSALVLGAAKTRSLGAAREVDMAMSFNQPMAGDGPPDVGLPQTVTSVGVGPPERVDLVHVGIP